jgi:protein-L-isoaspartate(D-aspartate) O-methyltransferase
MPQALIDQLASPGRLFIPVGNFSQGLYHLPGFFSAFAADGRIFSLPAIVQVDKDADGQVTERRIMGVRVRLTTVNYSRLLSSSF